MNYDNLPSWWPSDKSWIIQDCLEGMKSIPTGGVDLVLTDPPFNVGIEYGDDTDDNLSDENYAGWFLERLREMERVIKDGYPIIVFSGDKKIHPILDAVEETGLTFHHFLKWNKPTGQRGLSGWVLFYRTELALLLTNGKPHQNILNREILYSDTLTVENTRPNDKWAVEHPCKRPEGLYEILISGFDAPVVLDPFLGSGTTLLACRKTGRIGLGFEINPEYESIIRDRSMADVPELKGIFDWRNEPELEVVSK